MMPPTIKRFEIEWKLDTTENMEIWNYCHMVTE
jgi:hypothetical protein